MGARKCTVRLGEKMEIKKEIEGYEVLIRIVGITKKKKKGRE